MKKFAFPILVLLAAVHIACGPKLSEAASPKTWHRATAVDAGTPVFVAPPPGEPSASEETSIAFAERALALIRTAQGSPAELGEVAVSLVITASTLAASGEIVTTGTLTAPRTPRGEWTYSPHPDDALVYVTSDLNERVFKFLRVFGDLSSVERFVTRAHDLEFSVTEENAELSFHSQRAFGRQERELKGVAVLNGLPCTVDVADLDSGVTTVESQSSREEHQNGWSGSLICGDEAFAFTESWSVVRSAAQDEIQSESSERQFSYYWENDDTAYRLPGGKLAVYRDVNGVSELVASGEFLLGYEKIGEIIEETDTRTSGDVYTAWLVTEDGRLQLGPEVSQLSAP